MARPGESLGPTYVEQHGTRFAEDWSQITFDWSGYKWSIHGPKGPPQAEHPDTGVRQWVNGVEVRDNGDLALRSEVIDGGVEILTVPSLGYGVYTFTYSADFNAMHPSNVLGIFTYDWLEFNHGGGYTELDFIEISRWNAPHLELPHASVTYYTDDLEVAEPGTGIIPVSFQIPAGHQTLTTRAEWRENYLRVETSTADGTVLARSASTERIPRDNAQQVHVNIWTSQQQDPDGYQGYATARGDEIVFHSFTYEA